MANQHVHRCGGLYHARMKAGDIYWMEFLEAVYRRTSILVSSSTEPVEFLSNTGVGWTPFPASVCRNSGARASRHRVAFNI